MKAQETVIFELIGGALSSYEDKNGHRKTKGTNYSLQAMGTVIDENGEIRNIRYVRNHPSIYVDVQVGDKSDISGIKRNVSKPQFTNGVLVVNKKMKNLLEFLRQHPANEKNQSWGLDGQKAVFRERNPEEIAKKINKENLNKVNAARLVYTSDFLTRIKPVADYLGFDVTRPSDLTLFDVSNFANSNPDTFISLLDSPLVERKSEVKSAIEQGIIKILGQRILWGDGRPIIEVPASKEPLSFFVEISFEDSHKATWSDIHRQLSKPMSNKEAKDALEVGKTEDSGLMQVPYEVFKNILKEKGVLVYKPPYFHIEGEQIKGNAPLEEYIEGHRKELIKVLGEPTAEH